jgi:serine/threonine protein kinase
MGADPSAVEQFGPYVVYERLGVGGMATVHRALERGLDGFERIVALKRLLPHLAADASFIKSFVREAKLASLLDHPNVVRIFECGRVGAQYFISMEHIDGRDVRRILRHARNVAGPPPIHVTVGLLLQLCDALDYAHHRADESGHPLGLVHRDVSPSNVLVTSGGEVKVIDFGIAKAQSVHLRTQTGRVKGKLAYMAPEALAGGELDARSDLFAAGVIGHELLTARPLFATRNDYQTLMKIQRGDIMPPSTFNQACPPELDAIVLRALALDADDRFHHASDLRDELDAMRRQYNLQTAVRDIAAWLTWAFALEAPASEPRASRTEIDPPGPRNRPSRARGSDDDEAVEVAWGGIDDHDDGEPVVLDDVPDVSDKHLASPSAAAEVRLELDDLADDIPTPVPSHGARPPSEAQSRAIAASLLARPVPTRPPPTVAARSAQPVPVPAREHPRDDDRIITPNIGVGVGVRTAAAPRVLHGARLAAASIAPAPRTLPIGTSPLRPPIAPPEPPPRAETATLVSAPAFVHDVPPHETASSLAPPVAIEDLGLASDTIPSIPAMRTSEPIVRFREPSTPPPVAAPAPARAESDTDTDSDSDPELSVTTGVAPPKAGQRPSSSATLEDSLPPRPMLPRVMVVAIALLIVAAAAGATVLYRSHGRNRPVEARQPAPPPRTRATLQFTVTPADATIKVGDQPTHVGSPWEIELAPGSYQIEIHRDGYKALLTSVQLAPGQHEPLSVALEPTIARPPAK